MKKILYILFVLMMLAGLAACRPSADTKNPVPAEDPTESVPELFSFSVYVPNDNADGFDVITVFAEDISAETVLAELKQQAVLPDAVSINAFQLDHGLITLDFNQAFADVLCSMGTSGELMIIGSVVNTFLDAFQAESVYFTVNGGILESGHTIYDFPIFFSPDPHPAG